MLKLLNEISLQLIQLTAGYVAKGHREFQVS